MSKSAGNVVDPHVVINGGKVRTNLFACMCEKDRFAER